MFEIHAGQNVVFEDALQDIPHTKTTVATEPYLYGSCEVIEYRYTHPTTGEQRIARQLVKHTLDDTFYCDYVVVNESEDDETIIQTLINL